MWATLGGSLGRILIPIVRLSLGRDCPPAFTPGGQMDFPASSDPEEVATVCDRVYVLRRGRIEAELQWGPVGRDDPDRGRALLGTLADAKPAPPCA